MQALLLLFFIDKNKILLKVSKWTDIRNCPVIVVVGTVIVITIARNKIKYYKVINKKGIKEITRKNRNFNWRFWIKRKLIY